MVTKRKNEVRPGNYYCYCLLLCLQEEQNTVSLSKLLEVVNTVRSFGNRCFNQSHYDNAKRRYKEVKTETTPSIEVLIACSFFSAFANMCTVKRWIVLRYKNKIFYIGFNVWSTGTDAAGEQRDRERSREGRDQDGAASSLPEPFYHRAPSGQPTQSPEIRQQSLGDRLSQHKGSFPLWTGQTGFFFPNRQITDNSPWRFSCRYLWYKMFCFFEK